MDDLKNLEAIGFTLHGPAYLIAVILFSVVGWASSLG